MTYTLSNGEMQHIGEAAPEQPEEKRMLGSTSVGKPVQITTAMGAITGHLVEHHGDFLVLRNVEIMMFSMDRPMRSGNSFEVPMSAIIALEIEQ